MEGVESNISFPLYKFIEKKYLDEFFTTGCLRLGTIYDFKDIDEYGESQQLTEEVIDLIEGALEERKGERRMDQSGFRESQASC